LTEKQGVSFISSDSLPITRFQDLRSPESLTLQNPSHRCYSCLRCYSILHSVALCPPSSCPTLSCRQGKFQVLGVCFSFRVVQVRCNLRLHPYSALPCLR
jgi:hypothetical protein